MQVYVPTADCRVLVWHGYRQGGQGNSAFRWDGAPTGLPAVQGTTQAGDYPSGVFVQAQTPVASVGWHTASMILGSVAPAPSSWMVAVVVTEMTTIPTGVTNQNGLSATHNPGTIAVVPADTSRFFYCQWKSATGVAPVAVTLGAVTDVELVYALPEMVYGGAMALYTALGTGAAVTITNTATETTEVCHLWSAAPFAASLAYPLTGE